MDAAAGVLESLGRFREACANQPSIGRRQTIAGVECIVHRPHGGREALPAVFVLHGGAWIGGDAVQIDSSDMTLDEVVEKIVALARAAGEGLS